MSIRSSLSYKANMSLLIFCLDNLSIAVNGVFRSPSIVFLSVSSFSSVSSCFIYFGAPRLGVYTGWAKVGLQL